VQIHCIYVHVMGIFALFLFFSQVDFAIIRLLADLLVTGYSTVWFIQNKRVVPSSAAHDENGSDQQLIVPTSEYDDEDILSDSEMTPAAASNMVILDLHKTVDGCGKQKFAIFDINEMDEELETNTSPVKQRGPASTSITVPPSDNDLILRDEEENRMLPLALSAVIGRSARGGSCSKQTETKKKLHPRIPSQTTVLQRNEDTRP